MKAYFQWGFRECNECVFWGVWVSCFEECVNRVFEDEGLVARKYQMRRVQVDVRVIAQVTARVSE